MFWHLYSCSFNGSVKHDARQVKSKSKIKMVFFVRSLSF